MLCTVAADAPGMTAFMLCSMTAIFLLSLLSNKEQELHNLSLLFSQIGSPFMNEHMLPHTHHWRHLCCTCGLVACLYAKLAAAKLATCELTYTQQLGHVSANVGNTQLPHARKHHLSNSSSYQEVSC